ncbi:hypothetical protein J6590_022759 [Homalodisca vitripennis]|nr:hypothetical protein J6590_022759 [Homalodisca vitripennis]
MAVAGRPPSRSSTTSLWKSALLGTVTQAFNITHLPSPYAASTILYSAIRLLHNALDITRTSLFPALIESLESKNSRNEPGECRVLAANYSSDPPLGNCHRGSFIVGLLTPNLNRKDERVRYVSATSVVSKLEEAACAVLRKDHKVEIARVQILSVALALIINTIELVLYRLSPLFCVMSFSHRPVVHEDIWTKYGLKELLLKKKKTKKGKYYNLT